MEDFLSLNGSKGITDEEILSLYKRGYSAKFIANKYNLNPARISKVLRDSGLGPRDYRTMPLFVKTVLRVLILSGFTYSEISRKTNVVHNYIREFVSSSQEFKEKSAELFRRKSNRSKPPCIPPRSVCPETMINAFERGYVAGNAGFCLLMLQLNATEEQIIYLFSIIDNEMVARHNDGLRTYILAEKENEIPAIGIGRNLGVSPTYVSKIIKETLLQ